MSSEIGLGPKQPIQNPEDMGLKPSKRSLSPTDIKSNKAAIERKFPFLAHIASGADKHVFIRKNLPQSGVDQPEKVYYFPVRTFFLSKMKTLRQEMAKITDIESKLSQTFSLDQIRLRLATGFEIDPKTKAFLMDNATHGDFEKVIREGKKVIKDGQVVKNKEGKETRQPLTLTERIFLCSDYLEGLAWLHRPGYAYGDIKPENSLVFETNGKVHLKIADFGKGEKVEDAKNKKEGSKTYKGNLRFVSYEGRNSQKTDVYGAALVLIRALEEGIVGNTGEPLLAVDDQESVIATEKRRGIEKFIVNHKAFPGLDEPNLSDKLFRRLPRQAKLEKASKSKKQQQNKLLNDYIDKLSLRMKFQMKDMFCSEIEKLIKQEDILDNDDGTLMKCIKEHNYSGLVKQLQSGKFFIEEENDDRLNLIIAKVERNLDRYDQLNTLLKGMVKVDPKSRLTMEQASDTYKKIFKITSLEQRLGLE